jgi:hypothetical protein
MKLFSLSFEVVRRWRLKSGRIESRALADFRLGSFATHAAKATDPLTSAAPPKPDVNLGLGPEAKMSLTVPHENRKRHLFSFGQHHPMGD